MKGQRRIHLSDVETAKIRDQKTRSFVRSILFSFSFSCTRGSGEGGRRRGGAADPEAPTRLWRSRRHHPDEITASPSYRPDIRCVTLTRYLL